MEVSYYENRADHGYAWDVKYSLTYGNKTFTTAVKIHLKGDDPGGVKTTWEQGIENKWNVYSFYDLDSGDVMGVTFDVQYVDSGAHQDVTVHSGTGRDDMVNWYLGEDSKYYVVTASHEFGHMIGNFDEYEGGATYKGQVESNTLMGAGMYGAANMKYSYLASVEANSEKIVNHNLCAISKSSGTKVAFDEASYLASKAASLNKLAYGGKTAWTSSEVKTEMTSKGLTPYKHYLEYGGYEDDVEPNAYFDDETYCSLKASQLNGIRYLDSTVWSGQDVEDILIACGLSPLEHYVLYGESEGITV